MFNLRYLLSTIAMLASTVLSQNETDRQCSCTPLVYKWKLNFAKTCPPPNINLGEFDGISDAFCKVTGVDPIQVVSYQIIELDQSLAPIKVKARSNLALGDGDVIAFSSLTAVEPTVISGGLQATLDAIDSNLEQIKLEWIVRFSNLCEVYPFQDGDNLGWMEIVMSDDPRPETCAKESQVPSLSPSTSPSSKPSRLRSLPPSQRPSNRPSAVPTITRTAPPTRSSRPPTEPPTVVDTELAPSAYPTMMSMSYSYSYDYSVDYSNRILNANTEFGRPKRKRKRRHSPLN